MGESALQQIGGLNEKEFLTAVDYVETPESGVAGIKTSYDASAYGDMLTFEVKMAILCWKRDVDDVIAAFPKAPTALSTVGGKNADGSTADRVEWGSGFQLKTVSPSSHSPSLVRLMATYVKTVAAAQESYPSVITVACASGVYTVSWNGTAMLALDNGTGSCGTAGLEFVKLPQTVANVTVIRSVDGTLYQRTEDRYFSRLGVRVDGTQISKSEVRTQAVITEAEVAISSGAVGEVTNSTTELSTAYNAVLEWIVDGTSSCKLMWCSYPVWSFS